jgi:histidinol-phosphatase
MKNDILEFALSLAEAAEAEILPVFRHCAVDWKPDGTEVTDADRRAEEVMREIIARRMPGHRVLGEEFGGPDKPTTEPLWVLDPIDGTRSFALGLPIFGTLIGYLENGVPQAGVIHFPAMGETMYAARGSGCWTRLRGAEPQRARVGAATEVRNAYVSACGVNPSDIDPAPTGPCYRLSALIPRAKRFRFVSDCVQHALVAQGRLDAAVDAVMNPWDIAALVPCVEEAGGIVTDLEGRRDNIVWRSSLLSSATPELHGEIISIMTATRRM